MAIILVDYENISGFKGLKGVEYLNENDQLTIFYSTACSNMAAEYMDHIKASGCQFNLYKLLTPRKNALDFYIATEAGRLAATGPKQIALISRDKGFCSIRDFFRVSEEFKDTKLVVSEDIEHGLEKLDDPANDARRQLIRQKLKNVDIEVEYGKMQECAYIRRKITSALEKTEFCSMTDNIVDFITTKKSESIKNLYTGVLHEFGLKNGVAIYRILKEVV